jgi:hypothetical protein
LVTRFIRNPDKEEFEKGKFLIHTKQAPVYEQSKFVPVPVKAGKNLIFFLFAEFAYLLKIHALNWIGDALLIHGLVVHKSLPNLSPNSRHIYTYHVYEGENSVFSSDNWMEENSTSFLNLYEH